MFKNYFLTKKIKKILNLYFEQCKIYNCYRVVPNVNFKKNDYGFYFEFNVAGICSFEKIIDSLDFLKNQLFSYNYSYTIFLSVIKIQFYSYSIPDILISKIQSDDYNLILGYDYLSYVSCNMLSNPHLLISGLSGQGKSYMIKSILYNLNVDVECFMLNCFKNDFKGCKHRFINGSDNILNFLNNFKVNSFHYSKKPRYIIIDELMILADNKKIQLLLKEFLCVARHYNVFIIGVIQVARTEDLKCKTLFNSRVSFKQVDKSSYNVALGTFDIDYIDLQPREFYYNFKTNKCKTYLF